MSNLEQLSPQPAPQKPALSSLLCFALYSASLEMTKLYRELLKDIGLTYPQYLVMVALWEGCGISVKELGERLYLDSGTLTPLLKRLEKMDLLQRRRNPKDERELVVSLTEKGIALQSQFDALFHQVSCAAGMSPADLKTLLTQVTATREHVRSYRTT